MITKKSLYSWIFYKTAKWQIILLIIIVITVGARVFPLEMQKRIINQAIGMADYQKLLLYCGLYLGAVVLAGVLKFLINWLQTYIGQKTLIHIREQLYQHILSLPLPFFRRTSPGLVISSLVSELATVSMFIGSAVAVPVVNILTLLAFAGYMFYLNPLLAGLSLAIYPIELAVIPLLQKRANTSNRDRINVTRDISGLIGEAVSGVHEVHANASYGLELSKFRSFVKDLFRHNMRMNVFKYLIKFTNNLFQSIGPFILFLVGGYLSIKGRFDLGALVAFLSAYEKVYDPWKELMDFYQVYQDSKVRYQNVMDYFDLEPEYSLVPSDRPPLELESRLELSDVYYSLGRSLTLLDRITLSIKPGEQVALVGFSGSGKSTLALVIGQIFKHTAGKVELGGREISELTKLDVARNIGVVAQHPFIFNGTVKENLLYSCQALRQAGCGLEKEPLPDLDQIIEVVQQVGLFLDVLRFGLRRVIPPDEHPELVEKIIRIRGEFQNRFSAELFQDVEFYNPKAYLMYSDVAANLCFAAPVKESWRYENLHENKKFIEFINSAGLKSELFELGGRLARETVDILKDMEHTPELFERSPIPMQEFSEYLRIVDIIKKAGLPGVSNKDLSALLKLALGFVPGLHHIMGVSPDFMAKIVQAREKFQEMIETDHPGAMDLYQRSEYIHSQSLLENIVFGRIKEDSAGAVDRVNQSIMQLLIEENILEEVVKLGLDFEVGSMGDRLSGGQRQKVALARVFLKGPGVMILDEATSALDNASQARIQNLLETKWKGESTLISVAHRLDTVKGYDKIAVMKTGKIMEIGPYDELMAKRGMLYELVHGAE